MSERGDREYAADIGEAIRRILNYTRDLTYAQFLADPKTQDAVVRNLEIMGEAVKHLSATFKKQHPDVEWSKIAGLRDRLMHHDFGVNLDILWNVIQTRLPELLEQLRPRE